MDVSWMAENEDPDTVHMALKNDGSGAPAMHHTHQGHEKHWKNPKSTWLGQS